MPKSVSLFRDSERRARFQHHVFGARPSHARAHRCRGPNVALARRSEQASVASNSELIGPDEIRRLCPQLNLSDDVRYPILGALYHPPGAIVRHDAVAWGYAAAAARLGVEIHVDTDGNGYRQGGKSRSRRNDLSRYSSFGHEFCRRSPAPVHVSRRWPDFDCRSGPFRSRLAFRSRSSRSSIRSSYREACTSTCRKVREANW